MLRTFYRFETKNATTEPWTGLDNPSGFEIVFAFKEIFFLFHPKETPLIKSTLHINKDARTHVYTEARYTHITKINITVKKFVSASKQKEEWAEQTFKPETSRPYIYITFIVGFK